MCGRQQQAQQIAERYRRPGYAVSVDPAIEQMPVELAWLHVDLIAERGDEQCCAHRPRRRPGAGSWPALSVALPAGASTTTTSQLSRTRRAHTKRDGPYGTSSSTAVDINAICRLLQATPQRSQQTQRLSSNANPAMYRRLSRRATACCRERTASAWHPSTGPPPPRRPPQRVISALITTGIDPT